MAAAVASCWNTRSGSSVDSTVTVVPSLMRSVEAAAAVTSDLGEDSGIEAVWCSPTPTNTRPTSSASMAPSREARTAAAVGPRPRRGLRGVLPKVEERQSGGSGQSGSIVLDTWGVVLRQKQQ